jgi:hypothetical protein
MKLRLEGGNLPFDLELLHREPLKPSYQPAQPTDFVLGTDPGYQEFLGLWTPHEKSDIEFYNPESGEFIIPENDGTEDSYFRLGENSYELVRFWGNYNYNNHLDYFEDACKKDYLYYERGVASFSITEPQQLEGGVVTGHAAFKATDARLIVNLRNCDEDTGELRYNLEPLVSYYQWNYFPATPNDVIATPESFSLECAWEKSEWQFMFCDGDFFSGRSYQRRQ